MKYRVQSGSEVHLIVLFNNTDPKGRQGDRSFSYEIEDDLAFDLVIDSKDEIVSPRNGRRTNIFNLGFIEDAMYKYFPNLKQFDDAFDRELWLVVDRFCIEKENDEIIEDLRNEISSFQNIQYSPSHFFETQLLSDGLDTPVFDGVKYLEKITSAYWTQNESMIPPYRNIEFLQEYMRLFYLELDNTETWRSILRKTDKLVGMIGDKSHIFLESFYVENDNILMPCLGS